MANLQYIGARYVPKFYLNPDYPAPDQRNNDWKSGVDYEALTIVTYNNDSYTSKKPVPAEIGNPADNVEYWACTTKYTAALQALQTTVGQLSHDVADMVIDIVGLKDYVDHNVTDTTYCDLIQRIGTSHYYLNADEATEPAIYGSFQGLTEVGNGNFLAMLIPIEYLYNYVSGHITDLGVIVEYDSDFNEIRRSAPIQLYHGRNMYYHNGKIYINADASGISSVKKVVVVNYSNFTLSSEIDISDYGGGAVLFVKDNYLFTGSPTTKIVRRELDGTPVEIITVTDSEVNAYHAHSIKPYKDGYLATYNNPNCLALLDDKFNLIKRINFTDDMAMDGEIKDFAISGSVFYLNQNARSYTRLTAGEYTEVYRNIYKIDIFKNAFNTEARVPIKQNYGKFGAGYVDASTTSTKQIGEQSDPFASVMMAIHYGCKLIIIIDDGSPVYYLAGVNDVQITGNTVTRSKIIIDRMSAANVSLFYINILEKIRGIGFNGCKLDFQHCTGAANGINISGCTVNSPTNFKYIETTSEIDLLTLPTTQPTINDQKFEIVNGSGGTIASSLTALSGRGIFGVNIKATYNGDVYTGTTFLLGGYTTSYFIPLRRNNSGAIDELLISLSFGVAGGVISNTLHNATLNGSNVPVADISIDRLVLTHII